MDRPRKVFGSFQFAFDERLINNYFRADVGEFALLPRLDLLPHGLEVPLHPVYSTDTQSMSENDFECLASTGVNTPGTMFPDSGSRERSL